MTDNPRKIMIVDDDETSREMLIAFLDSKYDCVPVSSGEEAIKCLIRSIVNQSQNKFDLILLDFEMPGANGLDVLRQLKKEEASHKVSPQQKVKVIMTTSHNDRAIVMACKTAGADQYILKPIDKEALLKKIDQVLPPIIQEIPDSSLDDIPEF